VKILLDENFPLPFLGALRAAGLVAEQVMTLRRESLSDLEVRARLDRERVLFLTQDIEFLTADVPAAARVLVSRLTPSRPLAERMEVWLTGVRLLVNQTSRDRVFELTDAGDLVPWQCASSATTI
jgi:hypothetical protein